ncbi:MAG: glycoside hydrolase family 2 protein [Bacillota bacterium]
MERVSLNGEWEIAHAADGVGDPGRLTWLKGPVPGMVQQVLLAEGRLPDPYLDRNAEAWRWAAEREWWYRRSFAAPRHDGPVELHFEGLDTFAEVYLNGELLAVHANMFLPLTVDVTGRLTPENELLVRLRSPLKAVEGLPLYPFWNGTGEKLWARKSQVSYGWDFTPPLVTTGIWKDVSLRLLAPVVLRDVRVETATYGAGAADLIVDLELEGGQASPTTVDVTFRLTDGERSETWTQEVSTAGTTRVTRYFDGLHYWWPAGLGDAHLYTLEIQVGPYAARTLRVGFRSVALRTRDHEGRASFLFVINGKPVFCKGANWIPQTPLLLPDDTGYRELLTQARNANMNMVRVWGGGIYEHDAFYEICDELGLMVWQDFMWGCAQYPTRESYMESSRQEAEAQVRRLRNHPSIVIWAGDNENDTGFHQTGHPLNRKILKEVAERLDPTRPYHVSSPGGGFDPNGAEEGDRHNWWIWHGDKLPYTSYAEDLTPFASEYGMQGVPDLETMRAGISEQHLWPLNDVWAYHTLVHDRLKDYMKAFGEPFDIESYIELSQRTQAASDSFAMRHYRSRAPRCAGSLVWQLNDIWPAVSWSLIDVKRRPKLSYWASKRAYAPQAAFVRQDGGDLVAFVMNDDHQQAGRKGLFRVQVVTFGGEVVWERTATATLPAAPGGVELFRERMPALGYNVLRRCAVRAEFEAGSKILASHHWFPVDERDLELAPVALEAEAHRQPDGHVHLALRAASFVQVVRIEGGTPDDYGFDLWPDRPVTVQVNDAGKVLRIRHLTGGWQEVPVR